MSEGSEPRAGNDGFGDGWDPDSILLASVADYLIHQPEQGDWPWEDHCEGVAGGILARLHREGWKFILPPDTPGLCGRCQTIIKEGTVHEPFNGNQMFACQILRAEVSS